MEESTEKALARSIEKAFDETTKAPTPLRPPVPLAEQMVQMERISRSLHNRIRTERLAVIADHDRAVAEIRAACERRVSDAIARAQEERDIELRRVSEEASRRLHDLGQMLERMEK